MVNSKELLTRLLASTQVENAESLHELARELSRRGYGHQNVPEYFAMELNIYRPPAEIHLIDRPPFVSEEEEEAEAKAQGEDFIFGVFGDSNETTPSNILLNRLYRERFPDEEEIPFHWGNGCYYTLPYLFKLFASYGWNHYSTTFRPGRKHRSSRDSNYVLFFRKGPQP